MEIDPHEKQHELRYYQSFRNITHMIVVIADHMEDMEITVKLMLQAFYMMKYSLGHCQQDDEQLLVMHKRLIAYTQQFLRSENATYDRSVSETSELICSVCEELSRVDMTKLTVLERCQLESFNVELQRIKIIEMDTIERRLNNLNFNKNIQTSFFKPAAILNKELLSNETDIIKTLRQADFLNTLSNALLQQQKISNVRDWQENRIINSIYKIKWIDELIHVPQAVSRRYSI